VNDLQNDSIAEDLLDDKAVEEFWFRLVS